ncbi:uncharacterized protein BJ171DRAFT_498062 [Polychytrium aggregatum]|uniref:uncharacterized protein n=1 Tax=Polychytrium aggregatum TaxID=110093 RepID=UPI0022FF2B61|nr:uncharacterized protein BJ171DRAFT_498062 [Polychytrium aggregatum]KAI9206514.1 hypothetical protein BJ171DRAFT_498062 [Polychytrium aggregatum]
MAATNLHFQLPIHIIALIGHCLQSPIDRLHYARALVFAEFEASLRESFPQIQWYDRIAQSSATRFAWNPDEADPSDGELVASQGWSSLAFLLEGVRCNPHIVELDLSEMFIGGCGAALFPQTLAGSLRLSKLVLGVNNIDDEGCRHIAVFLSHNSSVETLDLSYNAISSSGVAHLSEALGANRSLKHLMLRFNSNINDDAVESLVNLMHSHTALAHVDLRDTGIRYAGMDQILEANRRRVAPIKIKRNPF